MLELADAERTRFDSLKLHTVRIVRQSAPGDHEFRTFQRESTRFNRDASLNCVTDAGNAGSFGVLKPSIGGRIMLTSFRAFQPRRMIDSNTTNSVAWRTNDAQYFALHTDFRNDRRLCG